MATWLDVRDAVVKAIAALPGTPPIKKRNRAVFRDNDPGQILVVSWGQDELLQEAFAGGDNKRIALFGYSIVVAILDQENDQADQDPDDVINWRIQIRQALYVLLPSLPVYGFDLTLGPLLETSASDVGYFKSSLTIRYRIVEAVNG
jgi:hypothetical protein